MDDDYLLEPHHKFDKTGGIGKQVGIQWFDAARYGNIANLKKLYKSKPELLCYNGIGTVYGFIGATALHWAAARGDDLMTKWLLARGASVNQQNNGGTTPLHSACSHGQVNIVTLLLLHGASTTLVDCCGDTPAEVVPRSDRHDIIPVLQGHGIAHKMMKQDSSKWAVKDMQEIIRLSGKDPRGYREKTELVTEVGTLLEQMKQLQEEHKQKHREALQTADDAKKRHAGRAKKEKEERGEDSGDEDDAQMAEEAKLKGNQAYKAGDYKTAIRMYTMALNIVADSVFYSNRSACYLAIHQPNNAYNDAKAAMRTKADWAKPYHRAGMALFALGRYSEAVMEFQKGLKLKPGDPSLQEGCDQALLAMHLEQQEYEEEEEEVRAPSPKKAAVPLAQRHPWFECKLCENRTRDHAVTPCCKKDLCGTCLKRAGSTCPYKCEA
eukprot:TRINITY_DN61584_c0_g1_i1.p1 TRINITY_DN61584_c0_g1~~TRINITY_DN61584_c0_g1_i1.p1  ORF type:complete len:438 (-),score=45.52 TRINITY_DN61584_c0_g1_i1:1211-2524(-)